MCDNEMCPTDMKIFILEESKRGASLKDVGECLLFSRVENSCKMGECSYQRKAQMKWMVIKARRKI